MVAYWLGFLHLMANFPKDYVLSNMQLNRLIGPTIFNENHMALKISNFQILGTLTTSIFVCAQHGQ